MGSDSTRPGLSRPRPASGELEAGAYVCGYILEELAGQGGHALVYRARDTRDGSTVALKVLRRPLAHIPSLRRRLRDEARAAQALDHASIVRVLDTISTDDGRVGIVMEWLEGRSLSAIARARGRLPLPDLLVVARNVADALEAAHAGGVIHRDVKGNNIIVLDESTWRLKVVDFGIAKLFGPVRDPAAPSTVSIVGTPLAMAPEQLRAGPVDARTDVYALGIMLFELATGRAPYHSREPAELEALHLHAPPPAASAVAPVPRGLDAVLVRALAKEPSERHAGPGALVDDLVSVVHGVGHVARGAAVLVVGDEASDLELEAAEDALRAAGLELVLVTGDSVLAVTAAGDPEAVAAVVAAAVRLASPRLSITVHAGELERRHGELVARDLVDLGAWPRTAVAGTVALTGAAAVACARAAFEGVDVLSD